MKRFNDVWTHTLAVTLLALIATGCTPTNVDDADKERLMLSRIDTSQSADMTAVLQDEPAARSFRELTKIFEAGQEASVTLHIYQLTAPPSDPQGHLKKRAAQLGLTDGEYFYPNDNQTSRTLTLRDDSVRTLGIRNRKQELSVNLDSGSELLVDMEQFHNTKGISPNELKPDAYYLVAGQRYMKSRLGDLTSRAAIYPYKVRHYMDAVSKEGGEPVITTGQIAVAYNTSIDGLAVIGPGDKVVVHMTPSGEVIGHESTLIPIARSMAEISGRELLAPGKAQEIALGRLGKRGVDLDSYVLTRSEFGYFRLGRNNIQSTLSPQYAFVFEPRSDKSDGRRIFEIIPAVIAEKYAKPISDDAQRDVLRKARLMEKTGAPDLRR